MDVVVTSGYPQTLSLWLHNKKFDFTVPLEGFSEVRKDIIISYLWMSDNM